jgi:hypothetical protein
VKHKNIRSPGEPEQTPDLETNEENEEEGEYQNEYLIAEIISVLKSYGYADTVVEDHIDSQDEFFYKIMVGLQITQISNSNKDDNTPNSYLIQLVRYSGNSQYLFSALNTQINSNLFFNYFSYQLKRLLSF